MYVLGVKNGEGGKERVKTPLGKQVDGEGGYGGL